MRWLIRILALCAVIGILSPAKAQNNDVGLIFAPTVQNAAYASGNAMGGLQTLGFFQAKASAVFDNFWIASQGGSTTAMTIYLFTANPSGSTCTDKSAFSLAAADVSKLAMAPFVVTPAVVGAGSTVSFAQFTAAISVSNTDSAPGPRSLLYLCIVANGAVTPASTTDLLGKLSGVLD